MSYVCCLCRLFYRMLVYTLKLMQIHRSTTLRRHLPIEFFINALFVQLGLSGCLSERKLIFLHKNEENYIYCCRKQTLKSTIINMTALRPLVLRDEWSKESHVERARLCARLRSRQFQKCDRRMFKNVPKQLPWKMAFNTIILYVILVVVISKMLIERGILC